VKIRFQADADLNAAILTGLLRREPRIDFQTAAAAGLRGLTDREVLELASREGRLLVSHDRKTMPRHFAEFVQLGTSPGVLIISQKEEIAVAIQDLQLIWTASDAEEWTNRMLTIPL
jgi:predicted nuclease of predicted toxin-antitoxin system